MSRETSPGAGRPYGLARICRVLEFPRSTIYAQQAREEAKVVPLHPLLPCGVGRSRSLPMPTC